MSRLLLLAVVLAALVPGIAPAAGSHARVWLAGQGPLVVKGTSFRAHERVVVTLTAPVRLARTVTATRTGAFVARFAAGLTPVKSGCLFVRIRAVGNRGSAASYTSAPIECANGPSDPGE
jgi:hypothetical protein